MKNNVLAFFNRKKGSKTRKRELNITKRQRFVIAVLLLSLALFFTEHNLGKSGFYITIVISFITSILFFISMYKDIKGNINLQMFVLPCLYTLAFGLFYFLVPARFISRVVLTSLYGIGLYSLFLSLNIYAVASIRTIALLSSARTVTFIITLISFFFLSNVLFTLRFSIIPTSILMYVFSFLLILQSIWTITLEKSITKHLAWVALQALCLMEVTLLLWFWPSTPTVISLFLTGFFYTIVGLSHIWYERRLFKGVIWEYLWVAVIVFFILIFFTSWNG